MKKLRIVIFSLIVLSILLVVIIYISHDSENKMPEEADISVKLEGDAKPINNILDYFNVKFCMNKYYNCFSVMKEKDKYLNYYGYTEEYYNEQLKENINLVYNLFDEEYIKYMNIKQEELLDRYRDFNVQNFIIDKIYLLEIDYDMLGYIVNCREIKEDGDINKNEYVIKIDTSNSTFCIYEYDYIKKKGYLDIDSITKQDFSNERILANNYNKFDYQVINEEDIAKEYFEIYKYNLLFDIDTLYNTLNSNYKEIKFKDLEEFKMYIDNNNFKIGFLKQYKVTKYDDYTQYICIDQNGNYYIFNETAVMQYTVMLDNYTVDLPQNIEKYKSESNRTKTAYNIKKFIEAINDKSYYYAYNLLNQEFKNNYFNTQEKFEEYIKNNFHEENEVILKVYKEDSGLNTYTAEIKNKNNSEEIINKTFIVLLGEETNFELSFNIK